MLSSPTPLEFRHLKNLRDNDSEQGNTDNHSRKDSVAKNLGKHVTAGREKRRDEVAKHRPNGCNTSCKASLLSLYFMEAGGGFEPPSRCRLPVYKTG